MELEGTPRIPALFGVQLIHGVGIKFTYPPTRVPPKKQKATHTWMPPAKKQARRAEAFDPRCGELVAFLEQLAKLRLPGESRRKPEAKGEMVPMSH